MPPSIASARRFALTRLTEAGIPSPEPEADWILTAILDVDRTHLHLNAAQILTPDQAQHLDRVVSRRCDGEPLQYILGETEFYSLPFAVTPDVLVPRPETEILVDRVIHALDVPDARICDVGTGSGAVAVALAANLPEARLLALDLSRGALRVASGNARLNGVGHRIALVRADIRRPFTVGTPCFHAVVSNPPYIPTPDLRRLPADVARFEPVQALDGGPDGLDVIRPLVRFARSALVPGGLLALEIDSRYDRPVISLLDASGAFQDVAAHPDLTGLPRVVTARKILVQ